MATLRAVYSVFSEKELDYCDRLEGMLADKAVDPSTYEVRRGPVEDHVDDVLCKTGDLPLFVFLDPYGLTIPFERVVHVLKSRDKVGLGSQFQPKTELLMNFSYEAVRRISGAIRSEKEYAAKDGQIRSLDAALGGDWWHDLARNEREGWVQEVLKGYAARIGKAADYGYITVDVADSLEAKPVYELILFTRHRDGLWEMTYSMSMARKEWRQWLTERREQATGGQAELEGLRFDDNVAGWVDEITSNIETLLQVEPGFVIENKLDVILGRTLGLARETHIRKALKALHSRGVIKGVPKGKLQRAYVTRG